MHEVVARIERVHAFERPEIRGVHDREWPIERLWQGPWRPRDGFNSLEPPLVHRLRYQLANAILHPVLLLQHYHARIIGLGAIQADRLEYIHAKHVKDCLLRRLDDRGYLAKVAAYHHTLLGQATRKPYGRQQNHRSLVNDYHVELAEVL